MSKKTIRLTLRRNDIPILLESLAADIEAYGIVNTPDEQRI